jgi:hypothetical protein
MTTPPNKITAFIADGEDSFVAFMLGDKWYPAVTASTKTENIKAMERAMRAFAARSGKVIRKYEFTMSGEGVVIGPEATQ